MTKNVQKAPKKKYNVYLLKEDFKHPDDVLTERAFNLLSEGLASEFPSEDQPIQSQYEDCWIFFFHEKETDPKWADDIAKLVSLPPEAKVKRTSSIVFILQSNRLFAITYGPSHFFIDKRKVVSDFGLRVAINLVSDKHVKSTEKVNLADGQKGAINSPRDSDFTAMGTMALLDIFRKISGRTGDPNDNSQIFGGMSYKFATRHTIDKLKQELPRLLERYKSDDYKKTAFSVIDQLYPITDKELIDELDQAAVSIIKEGGESLELSIPEAVSSEKDISFAQFWGFRSKKFYLDISLETYREALGQRLEALDVNALRKHSVASFGVDGAMIDHSTVLECIIGTLDYGGERYVANEGEWYKVDADFKTRIDQHFLDHRTPTDDEFPKFQMVEVDTEKGAKTVGYESESDYNARTALELGFANLDRKLVSVPGVPNSRLEFCDWLDFQGKRILHVKKSSRSSSVLSHFFNQGFNPLRTFQENSGFRDGVAKRVGEELGEEAKIDITTPPISRYSVQFVIADAPRKNGEHNIPFFSRITFFEKSQLWDSMGVKVQVSFITLDKIVKTKP